MWNWWSLRQGTESPPLFGTVRLRFDPASSTCTLRPAGYVANSYLPEGARSDAVATRARCVLRGYVLDLNAYQKEHSWATLWNTTEQIASVPLFSEGGSADGSEVEEVMCTATVCVANTEVRRTS